MTISANQFIAAVHRRMIVTQLLEYLGKGCLAGCLLAVVLIAIAAWRSMSPLPILIFCLSIGLLLGGSMALRHWPTRLVAAAKADRQLHLDDLLTTLLLSAQNQTDDFSRAVLAMADARCRMHSPSDVMLRQLGIRSWAGIGLGLGVAVTLAMIPLGGSNSLASDSQISILSGAPAAALQSRNEFGQNHAVPPRNLDPMNESPSINSAMSEQSVNHAPVQSHTSQSSKTPRSSNGRASGSTTTDAANLEMPNTATNFHPGFPGEIVAGGGNSSQADPARTGESGIETLSAGSAAAIPSPIPEDDHASPAPARQQSPSVQDTRVPAADRDLVREFFSGRS